jgi:NarL family two-component system response regulator LiaR
MNVSVANGPTQVTTQPARPYPIRVLVADDHAIVRRGICALLATEPDIEVVGEALDGYEALAKTQELRPDVILMDLVMPGMDGLEATQQITSNQAGIRVLVLTGFSGDEKVFPAIRAGALGYLLKDSGPGELVQAIRQVYEGESSLHPTVARKLLREFSPRTDRDPQADLLTTRELQVLRLIAQGQTNRQIAEELSIAEATTRSHVTRILKKLDVESRTQAALYALREGIASLNEASFP